MLRVGVALSLAAVACNGRPILFEEVDASRVPQLAQTRYVPNRIFNSGLGAAVGDVDGDQRIDVYLAGGGLYLNRPDPAGFRLEAAPDHTPPPDFALIGVAFADFDRDGDLDLALCGQGGAQLWINDGSGHFADATTAAKVAGSPDDISLSVIWGDLDGDGWLDLAVANYGLPGAKNDQQPSRLYLNQRDGTFVELTAPLAKLKVRAWMGAFADLDGDGRLDLFLGDDAAVPFFPNAGGRHDLMLLNRGLDPTGLPVLVESSAQFGLAMPRATMGLAVGNSARGPGWDVFITDILAGWLYRTDPGGQPYRDITEANGIKLSGLPSEAWWMWGVAFADLDGDGLEDLWVAQSPIFPNQDDSAGPVLLRNQGDHFEMVRYGLGGPMNARAVLPVDLDGDGDDDAIVAPFFDRFRFFTNTAPERHFVRLRLAPTVSAPGAAGAVVVAQSGEVTQRRMRVAGGQPHSTGEDTVDFGLGDAVAADLTITWPSGAVQKVPAVSSGERRTVTEPRWIAIADSRPPADGTTRVRATVDVSAAGLGGPGSRVTWASSGVTLDAVCDGNGVATFELPARAAPGAVHATLTIDGRMTPAHPALDYN